MKAKYLKLFLHLNVLIQVCYSETASKPNIVVIMADDMGWNDVSFHGSDQIITPNIDALAYNGVILNRFYTPPMCTPSRSSYLTGKYSNRLGMQHFVIQNDEPYGLGLEEKIMPQYLKDAGYSTHLIGKWHQGFFQKQYTPTMRGFDSFLGILGGLVGYYNYTHQRNEFVEGLDLRRNLTSYHDYPKGTYATDLFSSEAVKTINEHNFDTPLFLQLNHIAPHAGNDDRPMEAPESEIQKFLHIKNEKRRIYAAMVSKLDTSVGEVVQALDKRNVMNNTVILFFSDNGGPTVAEKPTNASNYPLRGQKGLGWEGAIRCVSLIYSPLLKTKGISNELIHITDILPTFAHLAGFNITTKIDGIDQWETISEGQTSARKEILHVTDTISGFSSYLYKNWKIVNGTTGEDPENGWVGQTEESTIDPVNYVNQILTSPVGSILEKYEEKLTNTLILSSRNQALVKCVIENASIPNYNCQPRQAPCVFDVISDPCEQINIAELKPLILKELELRLGNFMALSLPSRKKPADPKSHPQFFNNTWQWWQADNFDGNFGNRIEIQKILLLVCLIKFVLY